VYAVALQSTGRRTEGRSVLEVAFSQHPSDVDIATALLQGALQEGDVRRAAREAMPNVSGCSGRTIRPFLG
jgi:hypothetical protein